MSSFVRAGGSWDEGPNVVVSTAATTVPTTTSKMMRPLRSGSVRRIRSSIESTGGSLNVDFRVDRRHRARRPTAAVCAAPWR